MLYDLRDCWAQTNELGPIVLRNDVIVVLVDQLNEPSQFAFCVKAWPDHHVADGRHACCIVNLWQVSLSAITLGDHHDFCVFDSFACETSVVRQAYLHRFMFIWCAFAPDHTNLLELEQGIISRFNKKKGTALETEKLREFILEVLAQAPMLLVGHEAGEGVENLVSMILCQFSATFDSKAV